jgi:hypothetical protein
LRSHAELIELSVHGLEETDASTIQLIQGMMVMHGIPNLILSMTPLLFDDPIAHVLSGCDVDLDMFMCVRYMLVLFYSASSSFHGHCYHRGGVWNLRQQTD